VMWQAPVGPGIRVDSGVRQGDEVTIDFDPMLAKLIVHAPDRHAAIRRLDTALADFVALGVQTNIGFLRSLAAHHTFQSGGADTDFLANTAPEELSSPDADKGTLVAIAAAAQRLGLDRAQADPAVGTVDEHTGHQGDPFRTLRRSFP